MEFLRNPFEIPQNSEIIPIGTFSPLKFYWNFVFLIVKFVLANSEHNPASLESSPVIDSSDFMHRKTFPPFFLLPKLHGLIFQVKQVDLTLAA